MSLVAGLIGAGSSLVGNFLNAEQNEAQRDWAEYMWNKNNEYNTPANQMKRLRAAGINPYFAISGGSLGTGNSSSPALMTQPHAYDFSPAGDAIARSVELYQEKRVQDADIGLKNAQAENQRLQSVTQVYRDIATLNKLLKEGDLTDEQRKQVQADIHSKWIDISFQAERNHLELAKLSSEKALSDAQIRVEQAKASYQELINKFAPQQQAIITSNLRKEGSKIDSEVYKNNREGALAAAHVALSNAQKDGVLIDNKTKSEMAEYIVDEQFAKANEAAYRAGNQQKEFYFGRGSELPYEALEHDDSRARVPVRNKAKNRSY